MASLNLLQLPTEIRLKILEYIVYSPQPLIAKPVPCAECANIAPEVALHTHFFKHKQRKTLGIYPEVLRTCHQLRDEGTPILYSNNASIVASNANRFSTFVIGHFDVTSQNDERTLRLNGPTPISSSNLHVSIKIEGDLSASIDGLAMDVGRMLFRTFMPSRHVTIDIALDPKLLSSGSHVHPEIQREPWVYAFQALALTSAVPSVKFTGTIPQAEAEKLAARMMRPIDAPFVYMEHDGEILELNLADMQS